MSNFICSECGMTNIDCGRAGYKTPKEIELEKRLEVSEKEHYRTLERLRIATKALKDYANSDEWELVDSKSVYWSRKRFPYPWRIAGKALKEMECVK